MVWVCKCLSVEGERSEVAFIDSRPGSDGRTLSRNCLQYRKELAFAKNVRILSFRREKFYCGEWILYRSRPRQTFIIVFKMKLILIFNNDLQDVLYFDEISQ